MKICLPTQITASRLPMLILLGLGLLSPITTIHAGPASSTIISGTAPLVPTVRPTCKIVRINMDPNPAPPGVQNIIYEPLPAGNNVQPQYFCPTGYVPIGIRVEDINPNWTPGPSYYESKKLKPPGYDYIQLRGQGAVIGTEIGSWGLTTTYFAGDTDQTFVPVQYRLNYAITGEGLAGKDRPNRTRLICARREIIFTSTISQCYNN